MWVWVNRYKRILIMVKISKRKAAKTYASIYADTYSKVAFNAFYDGMVFWDMVKSGAITENMINEDFLAILSDTNHPTEL